jgi:5-(carboxyamino)imidazole ribonucleotide mutase
MGSDSDWQYMSAAYDLLTEFGIPCEARVISAHRTPDVMTEYAKGAEKRGLSCIIAGAGGAAHVAGMIAAMTLVPVLGVPIPSTSLNGLDSLLSIVQMPGGIPVGTLAIGKAGATNAAILAAEIIGLSDPATRQRVQAWRDKRREAVMKLTLPPNA